MSYGNGQGASGGDAIQDQAIGDGNANATMVLPANRLRKEAILSAITGTAAPGRVGFDDSIDTDIGIPLLEDATISLCTKGEVWVCGSGGLVTVGVAELLG